MRRGGRGIVGAVVLGLSSVVLAQAFPGDDPASRAAAARVEYEVSLERAHSQLVDIVATFPTDGAPTLDLRLPTWRPGRYEILDPSGTVVALAAADDAGRALPVCKVDKATWRVETNGCAEVRATYSVYANSLRDRTRHADDTHAFLSGSTVFLYSDGERGSALRVRVDAPDGWHVATGLAPDPAIPEAWVAPGYDVLVDSPLEIGEHFLTGFDVDGTPHEIAIWGPVEPDGEGLCRDFGAIVRAQRDIFEGEGGALPYGRYVFLIHAQPGIGGGTEHMNSTIMQTRPASFESESAYAGFLGLVSHEMFHTWNVKRLRPAGLVPYDYQHENYTDLLWVAEGTTTYYSGVTLVRAGLLDPDKYLAQLSGTISSELRRPGSAVQSLADSSFDAWVKFNKSTPNDVNTTVSFYSKGALVSLMLDMEIRRRTENAITLDHVLRDLYQKHPLAAGGFTTWDMLESLRRLSGAGFEDFFAAYVTGTEPLDLASALRVAGIDLRAKDPPKGSYLGLSMAGKTVRGVRADGPAFSAGVQTDDVLDTVNAERFEGSLDDLLKGMAPGTTLLLGLERRGEAREIEVTTVPPPIERWTLERVAEPTALQRSVQESWLGQPWPRAAATPALFENLRVPSDP